MNYEEAKEKVKYFCVGCKDVTKCDDCEFPIIYEALEKQIPKKPEQEECARHIFYCPNCTGWFNGYHKPHHCECGQALDWSDEKHETICF